jgi:hypothetical protein
MNTDNTGEPKPECELTQQELTDAAVAAYAARAASLTAAAMDFFERTLTGLGREDILRNSSILVSATYLFSGKAKYNINTFGLHYTDPGIYDILSRDFTDGLDAAKHLAFCACHYALQNAEVQLATKPDEQGWMTEPMSYWYELREQALEVKNKFLSDITL